MGKERLQKVGLAGPSWIDPVLRGSPRVAAGRRFDGWARRARAGGSRRVVGGSAAGLRRETDGRREEEEENR